MKGEITLVVMAAGFGSRFGGTKQLERVGPSGALLLDYSIYDAIRAGFSKVVFIVRAEISDEFHKQFNEKLSNVSIEIEIVIQDVCDLPEKFLPTVRTKPWGTGHALFATRDVVRGPFCVINADDFYGASSYLLMRTFLEANSSPTEFALAGFPVSETLSPNGSVSRGICSINPPGKLEKIVEKTEIQQIDGRIISRGNHHETKEIDPLTLVSMNMWGFTPKMYEFIEREFEGFLQSWSKSGGAEFYIPEVVDSVIKTGEASVNVLRSEGKWVGLTYQKDKLFVDSFLRELHVKGLYPDSIAECY